MNYSKTFKILRSVYALEQRDLAKIVGVNPSYISMIESGKKKPSKKILSLLSKNLKIPQKLIHLLSDESSKSADEATKKELGELLLRILKSEKQ